MAQKTKISQRMAMGLLPIIGKTRTKRQVENYLRITGKLLTICTLELSYYFDCFIWGFAIAATLAIIEGLIIDAFLKAMYGDGKYTDENGDTDPLMQLFKTLKDLNDDNLTKKKENV